MILQFLLHFFVATLKLSWFFVGGCYSCEGFGSVEGSKEPGFPAGFGGCFILFCVLLAGLKSEVERIEKKSGIGKHQARTVTTDFVKKWWDWTKMTQNVGRVHPTGLTSPQKTMGGKQLSFSEGIFLGFRGYVSILGRILKLYRCFKKSLKVE